MSIINPGDLVLFQGDSVTDCGRSRADDSALGYGYAGMIAAQFTASYPEEQVRFINRGVSGNRVRDLLARWDQDCIVLQPNVVSILIGINDTWRRFDSADPTSTEAYLADYHRILTRVRQELGARLILLDPFVLPALPDRRTWREDLNPRIDGIRDLAREFSAIYVPLDGIFAAASVKAPCAVWSDDGVHPTAAGHALIAQAWLDAALD
jgi:acyl-CoA thioesterase I